MTPVLLLKGPEGNKYKGTQVSEDVWNVETYINLSNSEWWTKQFSFIHPRISKKYTSLELNQTFTVLAASETYIEPCPDVVIHWD